MAANIGPLVAKITANAEGVSGGVNDAVARLEKGAGAIGAAGKKAGDAAGGGMLSGLKSGLAGIGGAIGSALDAAAGIAKIGAVGIGAAIAGGVAGYMSQADKLRNLQKGSLTAGVNPEDLQTVATLTGDLGLASTAMAKFTDSLARAAAVGEAGTNGFTKLGLNARELAGNPLEAFGAFNDQVNKLGSVFEKTQAAQRVFGDTTFDIFHAIERGSAGIAKARAQMDAFGATMTGGMIGMMRQAEVATRTVGLFKDGITNQIVIGAGAILAELGERFGTWGIKWDTLGRTIVSVTEKVVQFGNTVWEVFTTPGVGGKLWEWMKEGFSLMGAYLEAAILGGMGRAMKAIGFDSWGKSLVEASSEASKWAGTIGAENFSKAWKATIGATRNGAGIGGFFGSAMGRIDGMGSASSIFDPSNPWRRLVEGFNNKQSPFDDLAQKLEQAKFALNAPAAGGQVAAALGKLLDPAQGVGGFQQGALALLQRGAMGGVGAMADQASPLLDPRGRLAMGLDIYNSLKPFMPPAYQPVGAMERGSREAYTAINEYRGAGANNIQDAIKAAVEEANRQQQEQIRIAEETLRAIENGKVIVVKGMNG